MNMYYTYVCVFVFTGETLLSPLVMCGPHGLKFLQPVELRLPHCASVNPDSWSFALKSSDSPTGSGELIIQSKHEGFKVGVTLL